MAITTMDLLLAGLKPPASFVKNAFTGEAAGQWHLLANITGQPGQWVLGSPGLNGTNITTINQLGGAIPWSDPSSGSAYLAKLSASLGANIIGLMLFDLLWYNTGATVTTTTIQAITTPGAAFPARDKLGTANGDGVEIWMLAVATMGNAGVIANTTLNYTNQAGTTGRSAGLAYSAPATMLINTMVPFGFQGSDTGVRAITNASGGGLTLGTTYTSGTLSLLAMRRVASMMLPAASTGATYNAFDLGMPQCFNSSNLYMAVMLSGTAAGGISGELNFAHG